MSERIKHATLAEAMHAIMWECGYLQKASADKLKYRVVTERQVNEQVRPLLLKHGVLVLPHSIDKLVEMQYEVTDNYGKTVTWHRQEFQYTFKFKHVDSPEFELVPAIGEANNNGDKGSNSCATIAQKYAILKAFYMETGDDPDLTSAEDTQGVYRPSAPMPPAPPKPPVAPAMTGTVVISSPADLDVVTSAPAVVEPEGWHSAMRAVVNGYVWSYKPSGSADEGSLRRAIYATASQRHPLEDDITYAEARKLVETLNAKALAKPSIPEELAIALNNWDKLLGVAK